VLRILSTQMSALAELTIQDEIVSDLARNFPLHARLLEEARLLQVARRARLAARSYEFESAHAATCFARLSVMLGTAFDRDPLLPWASEALRETMPNDERVDALYDAALGHLHEIAADFPPDRGPAAPTLARLRELSAGPPQQSVAKWVAAAFPARCAHLGLNGAETLSAHAVEEARQMRLDEPGPHLVALLIAAFGVGFADDPALPWPPGVGDDLGCREWLSEVTSALVPWAS
jgi:hypothetical protein